MTAAAPTPRGQNMMPQPNAEMKDATTRPPNARDKKIRMVSTSLSLREDALRRATRLAHLCLFMTYTRLLCLRCGEARSLLPDLDSSAEGGCAAQASAVALPVCATIPVGSD